MGSPLVAAQPAPQPGLPYPQQFYPLGGAQVHPGQIYHPGVQMLPPGSHMMPVGPYMPHTGAQMIPSGSQMMVGFHYPGTQIFAPHGTQIYRPGTPLLKPVSRMFAPNTTRLSVRPFTVSNGGLTGSLSSPAQESSTESTTESVQLVSSPVTSIQSPISSVQSPITSAQPPVSGALVPKLSGEVIYFFKI